MLFFVHADRMYRALFSPQDPLIPEACKRSKPSHTEGTSDFCFIDPVYLLARRRNRKSTAQAEKAWKPSNHLSQLFRDVGPTSATKIHEYVQVLLRDHLSRQHR